jgi:hypothetical protein
MPSESRDPRTFTNMVLVLLEDRFPWLAHGSSVPVSGADTMDELSQLHHALLEQSATLMAHDHTNQRLLRVSRVGRR